LCGYFVEYKNINFAIKEIAQRQRGCGNWDSFVKMTTSAVACRWVWFITCTLHRNLEEGMFAIHFSDLIRFKVRVLIRLPVIQIYLFIKKLKWCCFYKKKKNKNQWNAIEFLTGSCQVNPQGHTGFFLFLFFLQPDLVPVPDQLDPESTRQIRPNFKTMVRRVLLLCISVVYGCYFNVELFKQK
jgi:hypothetical protein